MTTSTKLTRAALLGAVCALALAGQAVAQTRTFDIPGGSLKGALDAYARQSGVELVYRADDIRGARSPGVHGPLDVKIALDRVLAQSGLAVHRDASGAVAIVPTTKPIRAAFSSEPRLPSTTSDGPQNASPPEPREAVGLEEIVVTAQRREQNLQTTPVAVTAVTAQALKAAGVVSTEQLDTLTPGLQMTRVANSVTPYLRGVGTQSGAAGNEASIATYVDGVYIASIANSAFGLKNIERVEVLRGPQGTLFGRNATGGLIHVITRQPSHDTSAEMSLGLESYETKSGSFYGTTGLSETVAADLAISASNQSKGWGRNLVSGAEVNLQNQASIRSRVRWDFAADASATLSLDYSHVESDIGANQNLLPGVLGLDGLPRQGDLYDTNISSPTDSLIDQWGAALSVKFETPIGSVTSTSAYRNYISKVWLDSDRTPLVVTDARTNQLMETIQQEFLLNGSVDRLDYTAGVFFYYGRAGWKPLQIVSATPAQNSALYSRQYTRSYAAYAQATYHLTPATGLTGGIRFTRDNRSIWGERVGTGANPAAGRVLASTGTLPRRQTHQTFDNVTWRGALEHKFSEELFGYLSVSRGFKSGIFNAGNPFVPAVRPEVLIAYEGGVKTELFDRTVRLNVSAFYYDYTDIPLNLLQQGVTLQLNASSAKVKGGEVELSWSPPIETGRLRISSSLSVLDGEYRSFPNAPGFIPFPVTVIPPGYSNCGAAPARGGNRQCAFNASGKTLMRAPRWSSNTAVAYTLPVSDDLNLRADASWYHNDGFFWDPENRVAQPAYSLFNAQLGIEDADGKWALSVFGRNLGNEKYFTQSSSSTAGDFGGPGAPRTFGVTLDYRFNP